MQKKTLVRLLPLMAPVAITAIILATSTRGDDMPLSRVTEAVRVEEMLRTASSTSGQPITAPAGPLEVIVSRYKITSRAALPVHKHPYPRLGYVVSGSLMVTNIESRQSKVVNAGGVIVEDVEKWHEARNLEAQPVDLVVVDLVKRGAGNVVPKK